MTLENILCAFAFNHEHQDRLINAIASKMVEEHFSLLIIDSFTSKFRVEFVGREELAARQQAMASMLNKLSRIASEFNVAVVITKYEPTHQPSKDDTVSPPLFVFCSMSPLMIINLANFCLFCSFRTLAK